jgi:exoribonuclease R
MEKNSAMAERQSNSRYIASFMQSLVGKSFEGLVCFSTKEKIFFFLRQFGIQGVCNHKGGHERRLKRRKRSHLKDNELLKMGNKIKVKLMTADTLSGDLSFELE